MADTTTSPATKLGTLNLAEHAQVDGETTIPAPGYPDPEPPRRVLMLDIESLALGTRPVITQVALIGYDLDEDEFLDSMHVQFYPVDPQQQIIPPRRISASTIAWWMKQSDEARSRFEQSVSDDFAELPALARHLIVTFNQLTMDGRIPYELVAKGPQFDVAAIETLLEDLGLKAPWDYTKVRDLRTLLATAGIDGRNVAKPAGFIPHVAYWDARWQVNQYIAARRRLAGR